MNKDQYLQLQFNLGQIAEIVRDLPLNEFLEAITKAETVGPILEPTLYRQSYRKVENVKKLAIALREFQKAVRDG